jgi:hypothetical protein
VDKFVGIAARNRVKAAETLGFRQIAKNLGNL